MKFFLIVLLFGASAIVGMANDPGKKTGHRIGKWSDKSFIQKVAPKASVTPAPYHPYYPY